MPLCPLLPADLSLPSPSPAPPTNRNRLINLGKAQKKGVPGILGLLKGLKLKVAREKHIFHGSQIRATALMRGLKGFRFIVGDTIPRYCRLLFCLFSGVPSSFSLKVRQMCLKEFFFRR